MRRLGGLDIAAVVALLGLALFGVRSLTGGSLGVEVGAEGYITGVGEEPWAQGSRRETVEVGDRVVVMAGRPVSSLAEIGDVLRSLTPGEAAVTVPMTLERYGYRYGESLSYQEVQESGFPSSVEPGDRVVGYDEHEVRGEIDRATILSILANRPGERVTFYFERSQHTYLAELPVLPPRFPAGPLLLLTLAAVVVGALAWRSRRSPEGASSQGAWAALGWATVAAPWALLLLWDPALSLRDPVLLGPGLLALALYRPGSLELHRRLFGGPRHPMLTLALFLPGTVVAFLGLMLTLELAPALWGGPVAVGKELDVIGLLRTGCGLMAVYHLLDLALWMRRAGALRRESGAAQLVSQLGLLLSSLALVSALLFAVQDSAAFLSSGFVVHAAGLVLALWLGDMAVAALPSLEGRRRAASSPLSPYETSAALCGFLTRDVAALGLYAPELVVVRGRLAMVMASTRELAGDEEDPEAAPLVLSVSRATEEVRAGVGLLRDESMALPLPLERPTGREEHSGEIIGAEEVVRSVVDHLRVGTAFSLLDEAEGLEVDAPPEVRAEAFYVWLIDYGPPRRDLEYEAMQALRRRFEGLWPSARQLVLESLLREEGVLGRKASRPAAPASKPPGEEPASKPFVEVAASRPPGGEAAAAAVAVAVAATPEPLEAPPELDYLRRELAQAWPAAEEGLLEEEVEEALEQLVQDDAPVILLGPPGIGRRFVARRLHHLAVLEEEAGGAFIRFPTAQIPPSVREIELFGDEEEAGHLRAAAGGVLYVDGAAELGDELLTRLISTAGEVRPVTRVVLGVRTRAGVAVEEALASLGGSLGELARGLLAHRVVRLRALEHRPAWLRLLTDYGLLQLAMKHERVITGVSDAARAHLKARRWSGGVPELMFALEQGVLRCDGPTLQREHLAPQPEAPGAPDPDARLCDAPDLRALLRELEGEVYAEAMRRSNQDANAASRLLGIKRATLTRGLKGGGGGRG